MLNAQVQNPFAAAALSGNTPDTINPFGGKTSGPTFGEESDNRALSGNQNGDIFSSFGNQGSLVTEKKKGKSSFSFLFSGQSKNSDKLDSDAFDRQYEQHLKNQRETAGNQNVSIRTEVERSMRTNSGSNQDS